MGNHFVPRAYQQRQQATPIQRIRARKSYGAPGLFWWFLLRPERSTLSNVMS